MVQTRRIGFVILGLGVILLGLSVAYFTYNYFASRTLENLNVEATDSFDGDGFLALESIPSSSQIGLASETVSPNAKVIPKDHLLYPGALIPARQWADPRGTIQTDQRKLLGKFSPAIFSDEAHIRASHISVPVLNIEATVSELAIIDVHDSRRYETPKFTVGHIPTTPNPGGLGNGWYFGHLESPIQNEGNVFAQLPRIPGLLENGEDVYLIFTAGTQDYLYLVTSTRVVEEDELTLDQSGGSTVTLVTCVPRLVYDHRLLVTATLLGIADANGEKPDL